VTKRNVLLAAAASVLSAAVLVVARGQAGGFLSDTVATEEVARGPFTRSVAAEGALEAVHVTPIIVPSQVRMPQKIAWIAANGSAVKAGEPVVLFDPYDAENLLADGKSGRESAEKQMEKARVEGSTTSGELAVDRALASEEMTRAESRAVKDEAIFTRNEIIESEIDRGLLAKRVEAGDAKAAVSTKRGDAEVALQEIARRKAEILIQQAEKGLSALRVTAPHDGFFALERSWRGDTAFSVGATVWPGQKLAEIPDLSALQAKVFVLEADAGGLKPGCAALVTIQGRPGPALRGKVARVDAVAKTLEDEVPTKYFETVLSLDPPETGAEAVSLKPGQSVRAQITLEDIPDALTVPRQAVFEKDDRRIVYKMTGGRLVPAEVTIGRGGPARVVIEKGLEPGDRIALRDPSKSASDIFSARPGDGGESETAQPAAAGGEGS
jgi:RND family efflux transporter MFP subunit